MPTYDSDYIFSYLYHTRTGSQGSWNATALLDPDVDEMIQSLSREIDLRQAQRHHRQALGQAEGRDDLSRRSTTSR